MDLSIVLAREFNTTPTIAGRVIELIDEGDTIPFIARYRKEQTGEMDDQQLRDFGERLEYLRGLEKRRQTILSTIEGQGKLDDTLRAKIEAATTLAVLEDLYLPYRPKRRTRAIIAREKGLEPLADQLMRQQAGDDPLALAAAFVDPEKEITSAEQALSMARDIIAEIIADDADVRSELRAFVRRTGQLTSKKIEKKETAATKKKEKAAEVPSEEEDEGGEGIQSNKRTADIYAQYEDYAEPVLKAANHRILALNRGEKEGFLRVGIEVSAPSAEQIIEGHYIENDCPAADQIRLAAEDSWDRLIEPSLDRELMSELTDRANEGAIHVFSDNLRQLLMQPPIRGRITLGVDPGYQHGCKLAVVDASGRVLETGIAYFTIPGQERRKEQAKQMIISMCRRHHVTAVSIGNGTASRESEQFIASLLPELPGVSYTIVNEAGASVWSASENAARELPNYTVLERGAISIARRMQDPLAELVKIDPKAIGVGQYQHDLKQAELERALAGVVEDCVSSVGVDLETASVELLRHVAGINETIAQNIITYRDENGFNTRTDLKKVAKLGPKAFEQCAGFLRVNGREPLDATAVHPESYPVARTLLERMHINNEEIGSGIEGFYTRVEQTGIDKLAKELGVGVPTLRDIAKELERPGRDPRDSLPAPMLRTDVLNLEDLKAGMKLKGTIRNVTDFGAFVDIGVHQDGLVHLSQMANRFITHPSEVVKVGDIVDVWVLSVDVKRHRIALSMLEDGGKKRPQGNGNRQQNNRGRAPAFKN
ncbi:MAG: RNA-binding transcriptional accessory protein [Clostridia bacterium]|nr:RNA-binding transcriptional accessory protein [Clostridia bacterium]